MTTIIVASLTFLENRDRKKHSSDLKKQKANSCYWLLINIKNRDKSKVGVGKMVNLIQQKQHLFLRE